MHTKSQQHVCLNKTLAILTSQHRWGNLLGSHVNRTAQESGGVVFSRDKLLTSKYQVVSPRNIQAGNTRMLYLYVYSFICVCNKNGKRKSQMWEGGQTCMGAIGRRSMRGEMT